jgi:hypothetical protein
MTSEQCSSKYVCLVQSDGKMPLIRSGPSYRIQSDYPGGCNISSACLMSHGSCPGRSGASCKDEEKLLVEEWSTVDIRLVS